MFSCAQNSRLQSAGWNLGKRTELRRRQTRDPKYELSTPCPRARERRQNDSAFERCSEAKVVLMPTCAYTASHLRSLSSWRERATAQHGAAQQEDGARERRVRTRPQSRHDAFSSERA